MDNNVGGLKDFLDRKKDLIRVVTSVIFWGSLWGLVEATIGYILQNTRLSLVMKMAEIISAGMRYNLLRLAIDKQKKVVSVKE
jgi:hypothetical protein